MLSPSMTSPSGLSSLAVSLALLAPACHDASTPPGRGFLLIAVDALRADHLSCMGYDRATTPNLDALADEGILFAETWSTAPRVIPAHASLFTGCDPNLSRRFLPDGLEVNESTRWALPEGIPRLAVAFLAGGFATAAFLDTSEMTPRGRFDDGFQVFEYDGGRGPRKPEQRGCEALSARLRSWLSSLPRGRSWFAYLHVRDLERIWRQPNVDPDPLFEPRPELEMVPPVGGDEDVFFAIPRSRWGGFSETLGQYEARYDAAVWYLDAALGKLFRNLRLEGRYDETTIAMVGTHGVQFGEAGLYLTGGMLTPADLHVPWILRPDRIADADRGLQVNHLASLTDVSATLIDLAGLEQPPGMHGYSHASAVRGSVERVREHAFASCGLILGSVTIGERWTLEQLELRNDEESVLSWFGRMPEREELAREVVYDRALNPYPSLVAPPTDAPADVVEELHTISRQWRGNVYSTWAVLQGSKFQRVLDNDAVIQHLIDIGYLGESP